MSMISRAQRLKMPLEDFGEPARRRFAVLDQADLDAMPQLLDRAEHPHAAQARIIAIARRKGLTLPDAWQNEQIQQGSADLSQAMSDHGRR